jgi:rhodanese-related sulfurtransferase
MQSSRLIPWQESTRMSCLLPVQRIVALMLAYALIPSPAVAATTTCPLSVARAVPPADVPSIAEDRSCLVDAGAVANRPVFDLRARAEFFDFHVPGAQHSTLPALIAANRNNATDIVLYDNGKSRSATFLLCSQLRRAGLTRFKLIDGGIAAWTQRFGRPERLSTNRLGDAEIAAALSDRRTSAVSLNAPLKSVLAEHRLGAGPSQAVVRRIVLADPTTTLPSIEGQLSANKSTTFYWIGTHQQLRDLIHAHLLQHQKRLAGPAQSTACSAL